MKEFKVSEGDKFVCIREVSFKNFPVYYKVGDTATVIGINKLNTGENTGIYYLTCKEPNVHGSYEFGLHLHELKKYFSNIRDIRNKKLKKLEKKHENI